MNAHDEAVEKKLGLGSATNYSIVRPSLYGWHSTVSPTREILSWLGKKVKIKPPFLFLHSVQLLNGSGAAKRTHFALTSVFDDHLTFLLYRGISHQWVVRGCPNSQIYVAFPVARGEEVLPQSSGRGERCNVP